MDKQEQASTDVASRPGRRPPRHPLRLALIAAVVTVLVLGVVYQRVSSRRSALLRLQQACLNYQRPQEHQIVYEEQPERAAELLKSGGEYVDVAANGIEGPPIAGHVPEVWRGMLRALAQEGAAVPAEPGGAVLFLHERQTARGARGLVCVEADRPGRKLRVTFIHLAASSLDPIPNTDVDVIPRPEEGLVALNAGDDPFAARIARQSDPPSARADLRFFAGRVDPKDPACFVLPYQQNGTRGEIELWVFDSRTVHYVHRRFGEG